MTEQLLVPDELCLSAERYWADRGREWTDTLPPIIAQVCERWSLQLGRTYPGASTAYVAEVIRADGSPAVMKIPFPEIIGEADALAAYRGNGAILLYDYDRECHALLLERCQPGSNLRSFIDEERIILIGCALMRRLWQTDAPRSVPTLRDQCNLRSADGAVILSDIADDRTGRMNAPVVSEHGDFDMPEFRDLAEEGLALLTSLPETTGRELLLHGDLHPGNIRRAIREPWLVIDPKPLQGDPAYEPIPLITETPSADRAPVGERALIERVGVVARHLDLSPARIAAWGIARQVDWALFCFAQQDHGASSRAFLEASWFHNALARYTHD